MIDSMLDFMVEYIIGPFLMILLVVTILFLPVLVYILYQDSKSPDFTLKKNAWDCTQSHDYQTTTFIMSGKVMVPMTSTHTECIQWSHK